MFELILDIPPSTNSLRTAFIRNGRVVQAKSLPYVKWASKAAVDIKEHILKGKWNKMPPAPYDIQIRVGKCNQSRDLDNFAKSTIDALVKNGVIAKDNLTTVHKVSIARAFGVVPDGKIEVSIDYGGEGSK